MRIEESIDTKTNDFDISIEDV